MTQIINQLSLDKNGIYKSASVSFKITEYYGLKESNEIITFSELNDKKRGMSKALSRSCRIRSLPT